MDSNKNNDSIDTESDPSLAERQEAAIDSWIAWKRYAAKWPLHYTMGVWAIYLLNSNTHQLYVGINTF